MRYKRRLNRYSPVDIFGVDKERSFFSGCWFSRTTEAGGLTGATTCGVLAALLFDAPHPMAELFFKRKGKNTREKTVGIAPPPWNFLWHIFPCALSFAWLSGKLIIEVVTKSARVSIVKIYLMCAKNSFEDSSLDCLTRDLNGQTFFTDLRRQEQRHRETFIGKYDYQHPCKYSSYNHLRGFNRLIESPLRSQMIDENGRLLIDALSLQLQDDHLSVVRRQWKKSKMTIENKIHAIQAELHSQTDLALKKTRCQCQIALVKWTLKNRWGWKTFRDVDATQTGILDVCRRASTHIHDLDAWPRSCFSTERKRLTEDQHRLPIDCHANTIFNYLQFERCGDWSWEKEEDDDVDRVSFHINAKIYLEQQVNIRAGWQRSAKDSDGLSFFIILVRFI